MVGPQVLENLWQQTRSAYVEGPLPAQFKEKLFARLSRFCAIPYCIMSPSSALRPLGMTGKEVLALLEQPPLEDESSVEEDLVLITQSSPQTLWPDDSSELSLALFRCSEFVFLSPGCAARHRTEIRRLLAPGLYAGWTAFLSFVKVCHMWVEAHPEISVDIDEHARENLQPLLQEEPALKDFFRISPELIQREREEKRLHKEPKDIYKKAPVGLCYLDTDLRYLHINDWLAALNGLPIGAHLGRTIRAVLPDVAEGIESQLRQVIETGEPIVEGRVDAETPAQPGVVRNFLHNYFPVRSEDGTIVGVSCVVTDITERKWAEEALRRAHEDLEVRVAERTSNLTETNRQLEAKVTERKRAGEALRERTERYELVATGACDAIWDWDVPSHRVYFSPRWKELRGLASDEVSDRDEEWSSRIHSDDVPRVMAAVQAHFEGKTEFFEEEYRIHCKDGSFKWVLDRGVAQRDADGKVVRMAGSESDITERKRVEEALCRAHDDLEARVAERTSDLTETNRQLEAEVTERKRAGEALRERTERYELVATGACDAIWDWDVPSHRVYFSPRWKELRGLASDEVSDRDEEWSSRIHSDDVPRVMAAVQAHFEGKTEFFEEEYRIHCKDGSFKWVLDRGVAQRDADGKVVRMAGSESDITERKRVEEALCRAHDDLEARVAERTSDLTETNRQLEAEVTQRKQAEESLHRFEHIVSASTDMLALIDKDFVYLAANEAYLKAFGRKYEEMIGYTVAEVFGKEFFETIIQPHAERCLAGKEIRYQQWFEFPAPGRRYMDIAYFPYVDAGEEIKGFVVCGRNTTERKRGEEALRESKLKLRQIMAERTQISPGSSRSHSSVHLRRRSPNRFGPTASAKRQPQRSPQLFGPGD